MIAFHLNGAAVSCDASPTERLSQVLRERLGAKGTKIGCDAGDCGACTVLLDGQSVCACLIPIARVNGRAVQTIESQTPDLTRLRAAFLRHGAAQCGICTPGMIMAASELLARVPKPDEAQVNTALSGVLCRCTGYRKIVAAVMDAHADTLPAVLQTGPIVGQSLPRQDGAAKVAGDSFGADYAPQDALTVAAVRSPHPHARFVIGDLSVFVARPGVVGVFTAKDIPGRNAFGVIPAFADQPAIAQDLAQFRGECVALVAFEAGIDPDLTGFPVEWTPLPALSTPAEAEADGAALIHPNRAKNQLIEGLMRKGDAKTALDRSTHLVSGSISTAFVEHAYI